MVYMNSRHSECRREARLEIDRAFLFSRSPDSLPKTVDPDPATHPPSPVQAHYSGRIEGVVVAHIYPCIGILTHDLPALRKSAVEYFPSFW